MGEAVGGVASEMYEGVRDLQTDAQILAIQSFLAFDVSVHGLTTSVVEAFAPSTAEETATEETNAEAEVACEGKPSDKGQLDEPCTDAGATSYWHEVDAALADEEEAH